MIDEIKAQSYATYNEYIKKLGVIVGFPDATTTYVLRRGLGNAVNSKSNGATLHFIGISSYAILWCRTVLLTAADDPSAKTSTRKLVMNHKDEIVFERNYMSRRIEYDTQAAYRKSDSTQRLIAAATRMSARIDPRRPKELTQEQSSSVYADPEIATLLARRNAIPHRISAADDQLRRNLSSVINSRIRSCRKALLKEIQARYDYEAPIQDIDRQARGLPAIRPLMETQSTYAFAERAYIAALLGGHEASTVGECQVFRVFDAMRALSDKHETPFPQRGADHKTKKHAKKSSFDPRLDDPTYVLTSSSTTRCPPLVCIFCFCNPCLSLRERTRVYAPKFNLQRHTDRCRLRWYKEEDSIPCPHPNESCVKLNLPNKRVFKNHAARVHKVFL